MTSTVTNLRLLRMGLGLTQQQMAKKLKVSRADYNRTELGYFNRPPGKLFTALEQEFKGWTFEKLMKIAEVNNG